MTSKTGSLLTLIVLAWLGIGCSPIAPVEQPPNQSLPSVQSSQDSLLVAEFNPVSKGEKNQSELNPLSKGDRLSSDLNPDSKGGRNQSELNPVSKGERDQAELNPISKGGRNQAELNPISKGERNQAELNPISKGGRDLNPLSKGPRITAPPQTITAPPQTITAPPQGFTAVTGRIMLPSGILVAGSFSLQSLLMPPAWALSTDLFDRLRLLVDGQEPAGRPVFQDRRLETDGSLSAQYFLPPVPTRGPRELALVTAEGRPLLKALLALEPVALAAQDLNLETTAVALLQQAQPHLREFDILSSPQLAPMVQQVQAALESGRTLETLAEPARQMAAAIVPRAGRVMGLELIPERLVLAAGQARYVKARVKLSDGSTDIRVRWSSSQPELALVNGDGAVHAFHPGQVTLKATSLADPNWQALLPLDVRLAGTVAEVPGVEEGLSLAIVPSSINLVRSGDQGQFWVYLKDSRGQYQDPARFALQWTSNHPESVSVDGNGRVTAQGLNGFAEISVSLAHDPAVRSTGVVRMDRSGDVARPLIAAAPLPTPGPSAAPPPPTVADFTPKTGAAGASVVLTGANFTGASGVQFNGTNAAFTVNSATQITATAPGGVTAGKLRVTTPDGTALSTIDFLSFLGANLAVYTGAGNQTRVAVAFNSTANEFLVVWEDGGVDIRGQRLSAAGALLGASFNVAANGNIQQQPSVAYNSASNEFLVVWQENTGNSDIFAQRVDATGALAGGAFVIANTAGIGNTQTIPDVAYNSTANEFLVTFQDNQNGNNDIYAQRVNAVGLLQGLNFPVCTEGNPQSFSAVAYNSASDEYLIVWNDIRGGTFDIYGQRVSGGGALQGADFVVSNAVVNQLDPDVAYNASSNEYMATWQDFRSGVAYDIYAQRITAAGALSGADIAVSTAANGQEAPAIACSPTLNECLLAWKDLRAGADVYAQRVNAAGNLVDDNFVISNAVNTQEAPAIAYDTTSRGFFLNWQDTRNGGGYSIFTPNGSTRRNRN